MNMVQRDFKGSHFSFRAEELPVPTDLPGGWRRAKWKKGVPSGNNIALENHHF